MIELSDSARNEIARLLREQPGNGIRIFIQGFG